MKNMRMTYENERQERYQAKNNLDYFSIEEGTTHELLAQFLVDNSDGAIYSKPADKLAEASKLIWSALCGLDEWRLLEVYKNYPEFFRLGQLYRDIYQAPNRCLMTTIEKELDNNE